MLPVINWASEELKHRYLPRIASGELQASYCLSEADAGSDVAAMRTRAVRDGDDYVLTGSKYWITNLQIELPSYLLPISSSACGMPKPKRTPIANAPHSPPRKRAFVHCSMERVV